jgi:CspA family cold shock protein
MRNTGQVKWFNESKGFGFLTDGKQDYFVHYKSIKGEGFKNLLEGQKVSFEVTKTPRGDSATEVEVLG